MADAIEKAGGQVVAMAAWGREQRELIKRTCAKDATDDELAMFLHIAQVSGLDPLRRQIHFMKYQGRVTIVADVNGLQARAAREADFEGILHAVVYAKDDLQIDNVSGQVVKHTSNPLGQNGPPVGAWATVRRRGMLPFTAVVRFDEYRNNNNALWGTKPAVMIDKCAKSTALRLAYPEQLGNIYDEAELGKEEERELNPPPSVSTPPATAAAAKEQLKAALAAQAGQVVDAPSEAPKRRMQIVDETKPTPPWERIKAAGLSAGMSPDDITTEALRIGGKAKRADLTEADAVAFCKWVEDAAEVPPSAEEMQQASEPF